MTQCVPVVSCTDGCAETLSTSCVIYKGARLSTLDVSDGDSLGSILLKLDSLIRDLALGNPINTYNYHLTCLTNPANPVRVVSVKKNGLEQMMAPVTYANALTAVAFLQTLDPLWSFTAPYLFSTTGADAWELTLGC